MNAEAQKARDAATRVIAVCEVIAQIVARGKDPFLADVQAQWAAEMGLIKAEDIVRLKAFRANPSDESWITK